MTPFVLALDAGTSSLKTVVYATNGEILASCSNSYEYQSPQPGWAETSTRVWVDAMDLCLQKLGAQPGLLAEIRVIAFTGQMHTAVLLDEDLKPLEPTILWLDRRSADETAEIRHVFHLPPYELNSTYTLPKLLWISRNQPDITARTRWLIWPKDYLRFLVTGNLFTDITEPGGAGLLDWETLGWNTEHLKYAGFNPQILPPILNPEDDAGTILPEFAQKYGINPKAKVIAGAGDVLALISAAPPKRGRLSVSMGSSSMIFTPLAKGEKVSDPLQRIYTYPLLPLPMLGGVSSTTGAALTWALKNFYPETALGSAIREALEIPIGAEEVTFLPFLAGERTPFWNDDLRASIHNLTLSHTPAHILRAVLESLGYSLRNIIEIFSELRVPIHEISLSGGGSLTEGLPQMLADICGIPVLLYSGQETVTRALYALACLSTGRAETFEEAILATFEEPRVITPDPAAGKAYETPYTRYKNLVKTQLPETR